MDIAFLLIGLAVVIALYVVLTYNALQTLKTRIKASVQEIGNQLKRQASLLPNLQESVKAYMGHEKGVYGMLSDARKAVSAASSDASVKNVDAAMTSLQNMIPKISVLVESNPELKADQTVKKFMDELTDTSDKLMYARRSVIDLSQEFNQKLVTFPSNFVASAFGFSEEKGIETPMTGEHMSVSTEETRDHKVSLS